MFPPTANPESEFDQAFGISASHPKAREVVKKKLDSMEMMALGMSQRSPKSACIIMNNRKRLRQIADREFSFRT